MTFILDKTLEQLTDVDNCELLPEARFPLKSNNLELVVNIDSAQENNSW